MAQYRAKNSVDNKSKFWRENSIDLNCKQLESNTFTCSHTSKHRNIVEGKRIKCSHHNDSYKHEKNQQSGDSFPREEKSNTQINKQKPFVPMLDLSTITGICGNYGSGGNNSFQMPISTSGYQASCESHSKGVISKHVQPTNTHSVTLNMLQCNEVPNYLKEKSKWPGSVTKNTELKNAQSNVLHGKTVDYLMNKLGNCKVKGKSNENGTHIKIKNDTNKKAQASVHKPAHSRDLNLKRKS